MKTENNNFHVEINSSNYDYIGEKKRYNFPTIKKYGMEINRGKSEPFVVNNATLRSDKKLEEHIVRCLFPTTLSKKSAVLDISYPYAGHYYCSRGGIYFDADIGVGQRLIDDQHIEIKKMINCLLEHNVLLRRESITNDVMICEPESGIKTPQDLADIYISLANRAFPSCAPYKTYFSSSGALAVEAAMKIACRDKHYNLISQYGYSFENKIMDDLKIDRNTSLVHPEDKDPLYKDYPFFFIAMKGAFHGRSFGALSLTHFRPVQKRGFPCASRVKHITFNGDINELLDIIDMRTLKEIYNSGENVFSLLQKGRIPKELIAGLILEPFQGEAGYIIADKLWIENIAKICKDANICFIVDEVQSFARTGKVFCSEYYNIEPDIITISKASVLGVTIASARFTDALPKGWHSCTWGGGKVFDNNLAWTVINTYINYKDPVFNGHTYIENQKIKEEYIRAMFTALQNRHSKLILEYSGLGTMWGFTVKHRDEVCTTALEHGLKLLSCGITKEKSAIRALFLSDVLTKEIDSFGSILDKTLATIENKYY